MCILRVCIAVCDHCAANVAALGGRSKPERLCAFCVCALLLVTTALLNVAALGGRSKPERLSAFYVCALCVCALLLVTTALLMLPHSWRIIPVSKWSISMVSKSPK